ncbi:hypothetical protein Tco_0674043 [Tanacetum coccineum]
MSFSKRQGNDAICYTIPLDSLKSWNDCFFWVNAFACPASFPWNTSKSVLKDPFPKSSQYNAEHYATLVAYPAPFNKYPEPFLCLIGISRNYTLGEDTYPRFLHDNDEEMDLLSFIQTVDPTKVRVSERQRAEAEPKLLDTTMGRVVPLLPVAPARASSELEASVDKLFDEGGSGGQTKQGDSASGGPGVGILPVSETAEIVAEDAAPVQPKHQRKRKTVVSDARGPSHPPKKLREDNETSTGPSVAGKSMSALQRLLAGAVLNPEVGITALPTLPFITSSVYVTLERESANIAEAKFDSFTRPSIPLRTVATTVTSTVDPATNAKEKFVESSIFCGDSSGGGADHTVGGFFDLTGSDFIVGGIRTVINPDVDLQKVYVPQWSVTNGSRLDDGRNCREIVDEFAPPNFFASIRGMDHDQLFTEFNVGAARQISLSAEVRMRAEYNIRERRRLNSVVEEKNSLLKAMDAKIETLKAQLLVKEAEAAEAIHLRTEVSKFEVFEKYLRDEVDVLKEQNVALEQESTDLGVKVADLAASVKVREQEVADLDAQVAFAKSQSDNLADRVHELETSSAGLQKKVTAYKNCMGKLEEFQDKQIRVMNNKFEKLYVDFVEMALHLEEKFYPHLLTTIAGRRWLLTYGVKLAIVKCLHSLEYIAAFNPSAESDYISALQELQDVNFSLLAELKSNKDASTETLMNILRLDEPLAERLGLDESQPHVDQLLVPIHHSPDRTVIGATSLLFSLDVSRNRVQKIRDNIANHRSALRDVFVPLVEPLSSAALEGTEGTSGTSPETTTALSVTFASTSSIPPISTDDYDVVHADGQEGTGADGQTGAGADVNPFPNVEDAELDIS